MLDIKSLVSPADDVTWQERFRVLFKVVMPEVTKLHRELDYYDPDTSYEEDVRACVSAYLDDYETLKNLIPATPEAT